MSGSSSTTQSLPQRQRQRRAEPPAAFCRGGIGLSAGAFRGERGLFLLLQPDGRRVCFQQMRLGTDLRILQKLDCLLIGTEQLKIQGFIIRRSRHPLSPRYS